MSSLASFSLLCLLNAVPETVLTKSKKAIKKINLFIVSPLSYLYPFKKISG